MPSSANGKDPAPKGITAVIESSKERAALIVADVEAALQNGRHPVVIVERIIPESPLSRGLKKMHCLSLDDHMKKKDQKAILEKLCSQNGNASVVMVTRSYLELESLSNLQVDTLLLAAPLSWNGVLSRYVKGLCRQHECGALAIYDYVDHLIPWAQKKARNSIEGLSQPWL